MAKLWANSATHWVTLKVQNSLAADTFATQ